MPVNRVENTNSQGKLVRTSIAAGFLAGGAAGYFKPVIKNGEPYDSFIKEIGYSLKNEDNKHIIRTGEILEALDEIPKETLSAIETVKARAEGIDPAEAAAKKAAFAKEELDYFLTIHSDEIGIFPQENGTLEDAVNNFTAGKTTQEIKDAVKNELAGKINNRPQIDYEELAKDYFDEVYDKSAKKYKQAGENLAQETIDFVKKAARNTRIKTGVLYGLATAAGAGVLTFIASAFRKK